MSYPLVVMCSMWRNDAQRAIVDRVEHLLAKEESWPNLRYVWIVGDSTDETARTLVDLTTGYDNVRVIDVGDTGIAGDNAHSRLRRVSKTGNEYFRHCDGADYILIHESDILSPYNLVPSMVALAERGLCPLAGWPVLEISPGVKLFYDCFCYRKDGQMFSNHAPYHPCYRYPAPFEVDSAGTIMLIHGEDAPMIHMVDGGFLDLCRQLREQGRHIYVDPTLEVVQPRELWQYHDIREYT